MWYYVRNNQRIGPVDENTLVSLIQNGTILRETLVWKQGMNDWQRADASELGGKFSEVPPSPPGYRLTSYVPSQSKYDPESFRKLWLWFTWLIACGTLFAILLIGIPALIAAVVINYILLYRFWALIQDGKARTSPGLAVGLCFVPFFNLYWMYVAWVGLAKDTNVYLGERNIPALPVNENLALVSFILSLCSVIPYIGILIAVASLVTQIILMKQFADAAKQITLSKSNASQLQ